MERFLFIFGFPFLVGLSLTVPDCSRPQYEKYYVITFVMSITWISIISSYMVRVTLPNAAENRLKRGHRKGKPLCTGGSEIAGTLQPRAPARNRGIFYGFFPEERKRVTIYRGITSWTKIFETTVA